MAERSIMIDFDDPRIGAVAEAMTNTNCKRVLSLLSDEELSESELASKLRLPAATAHYTIKKLTKAGLIKPVSSLWSVKGREVKRYTISRKRIIISPKSIKRGVLPAFLASIGIAGLLRWWEIRTTPLAEASIESATFSMKAADSGIVSSDASPLYSFLANAPNSWAWFLIGALSALCIYLIWSWYRD